MEDRRPIASKPLAISVFFVFVFKTGTPSSSDREPPLYTHEQRAYELCRRCYATDVVFDRVSLCCDTQTVDRRYGKRIHAPSENSRSSDGTSTTSRVGVAYTTFAGPSPSRRIVSTLLVRSIQWQQVRQWRQQVKPSRTITVRHYKFNGSTSTKSWTANVTGITNVLSEPKNRYIWTVLGRIDREVGVIQGGKLKRPIFKVQL